MKDFTKKIAKLGLLAGAVALPVSLIAEPDGVKEPKTLAKQLDENLADNEGALRDLIRRAVEEGGHLELDMDQFEELMDRDLQAGAPSEVIRRMMERKWMNDLGGQLPRAQANEDDRRGNTMRGFLNDLKSRLGGRSNENEREHGSVLAEYRPVIKSARNSTVALISGRQQVALGTIVSADGYIVTKASEVERRDLICKFQDGAVLPAKVLDVYEPLDIALLRVDAKGLSAADWAGDSTYEPGTFLAAPGIGEDPVAIGVVSVVPRNLSERTKGFLGVLPQAGEGGVQLLRVTEGTPAAKAGLKVDDLIVAIDGATMANTAAFRRAIAGQRPGDTLKFRVNRGGDEKDIDVTLGSRELLVQLNGGELPVDPRSAAMNSMGGKLSVNRAGYTSAMQTDLTLEPIECGGPLVDLDGKVVGVNIARGGRVKSYAIPSNELAGLLADVDSGRFTVTDPVELQRSVNLAEAAIARAEAALDKARKDKAAAERALEAVTGK